MFKSPLITLLLASCLSITVHRKEPLMKRQETPTWQTAKKPKNESTLLERFKMRDPMDCTRIDSCQSGTCCTADMCNVVKVEPLILFEPNDGTSSHRYAAMGESGSATTFRQGDHVVCGKMSGVGDKWYQWKPTCNVANQLVHGVCYYGVLEINLPFESQLPDFSNCQSCYEYCDSKHYEWFQAVGGHVAWCGVVQPKLGQSTSQLAGANTELECHCRDQPCYTANGYRGDSAEVQGLRNQQGGTGEAHCQTTLPCPRFLDGDVCVTQMLSTNR